jgi:hypothetical protein
MADRLTERLDKLGRRYPRLMLATTIVVVIMTTLILVYNSKDTAIVYRAF